MHVCRVTVVLIVFLINFTPSQGYSEVLVAEALVIPNIENRADRTMQENTPRPSRAMTMGQVKEEFGAPRDVLGPVGNPPITRWVYHNFTVHFEGEYVIHSVANRKQ